MFKLNETQINPLAQTLLSRLTTLGFSCKGKPPVIDQAFELVAAIGGYRNQHVMRAALRSAKDNPAPTHNFVRDYDNPNYLCCQNCGVVATDDNLSAAQHFACKPNSAPPLVNGVMREVRTLLKRLGYRVVLSDFGQPYWELGDYGSEDFGSADDAWRDAWVHASNVTKGYQGIPDSEWTALDIKSQLTLVTQVWSETDQNSGTKAETGNNPMLEEITRLQTQHSDEHPVWSREHWGQEAEDGDTQLGYWEWVVHQLEAAEFDEDHEKALALGFRTATQMREHAIWLKLNGTSEYQAWVDKLNRAAVDSAFAAYDFGSNFTVADHDGWEYDGEDMYAKTVFLENLKTPQEPTIRMRFYAQVKNGVVLNTSVSA